MQDAAAQSGNHEFAEAMKLAADDLQRKGLPQMMELIANAPVGTTFSGIPPTSFMELAVDDIIRIISEYYLSKGKGCED